MSLPANVSEAQFMQVVHEVAERLTGQFGGIHGGKEDFCQQVALWALEAIPKWDPSRPLPNFLFAHAKNRALNTIRDRVHRFDVPCRECHEGRPCRDGAFCKKYAAWSKRNQAKASLSRVLPDNQTEQGAEHSKAEDEVVARELASKIEAELPDKLRDDYQKMLEGDWRSVSRSRRDRIQKVVADILGDPDLSMRKSRVPAKNRAGNSHLLGL